MTCSQSQALQLQLSMLENKLETEMTKMSKMVRDTISCLTDHMNKRLGEVDSKFDNLLTDLVPPTQNANANSTANPTSRHNPESGESVMECSTKPEGDHTLVKMRPQNYNGTTDFDDFLSQFEITCEINGWQYRDKSLYLRSCLTDDARSLLSELDHEGRRD